MSLVLFRQSLEGLLEGMNPPPSDPELFVSFRDCHLLILKMIQVQYLATYTHPHTHVLNSGNI